MQCETETQGQKEERREREGGPGDRISTDTPSCPYEVLGLDLACAHVAILCGLLDVLDQFLLLVLEFHPLPVEFSLGLF